MAGVLAIEGLSKSFGELAVLRGVSFTVQPGRILGFLGRNGAGKTTTMRCVFGLLDPDAGVVRYDGQGLTRATRRRFGYMPEERGLYPKMGLSTQLAHFGRLAGMGRARPAPRPRCGWSGWAWPIAVEARSSSSRTATSSASSSPRPWCTPRRS